MITIKRLRELLAKLPDDAQCHAYEGEDCGITIHLTDGRYAWIRMSEGEQEDTYIENIPL